jgi:hypothetical protein
VLTEFILSLVQAFLRTGYYLPDHPQAKKAKVGLYNRFKSLFAGRHELTFMLKEMGETQNILVDGPLPETQRLDMLMTKGMAEVYVPRLSNFLERKDLVRLTLKETMSEEEFSRFVDVMSEPSFQTLDSIAKNAFTDRLREMQITHSWWLRCFAVTPRVHLRLMFFLVGGNVFYLFEQEIELIQAVEQAVPREVIDGEIHAPAIGKLNRSCF